MTSFSLLGLRFAQLQLKKVVTIIVQNDGSRDKNNNSCGSALLGITYESVEEENKREIKNIYMV